MPSYAQIDKQIDALGVLKKVLPSTELKGLPDVMHETEMVKGIACGRYNDRSGVIVATNERVFFFVKGRLWGSQLEEFRYENITSVQYSTGLISSEITIFVAGNAAKIDMVPTAFCKPFVESVQKIIGSQNASASTVNNDDDLLAKLERLAALKSSGMLTDEEFAAAKKKLLA